MRGKKLEGSSAFKSLLLLIHMRCKSEFQLVDLSTVLVSFLVLIHCLTFVLFSNFAEDPFRFNRCIWTYLKPVVCWRNLRWHRGPWPGSVTSWRPLATLQKQRPRGSGGRSLLLGSLFGMAEGVVKLLQNFKLQACSSCFFRNDPESLWRFLLFLTFFVAQWLQKSSLLALLKGKLLTMIASCLQRLDPQRSINQWLSFLLSKLSTALIAPFEDMDFFYDKGPTKTHSFTLYWRFAVDKASTAVSTLFCRI